MTIDADGWFDWAERAPGPATKVWPGTNTLELLVGHSMEGWWATGGATVLADPNGGSWHGTLLQDGRLLQHYPLGACPWASGNELANRRGVAFEMEGLARDNPPTAAQQASGHRLLADLAAYSGRRYHYEPPPAGPAYKTPLPTLPAGEGRLVQHCEVSTWMSPNAGPTACPSGRWSWLFTPDAAVAAATTEEQEMTESAIRALIDAALAHQFPALLRAAVEGGFSEDAAKADIAAFLAALRADTLPDHHHAGAETGAVVRA
jgi:hypothetical protein